MRKKGKLLALLLAFVMSFAVIAPAANAQRADAERNELESDAVDAVTKTVTLHKILMEKRDFDSFKVGKEGIHNTKYDGNQIGNLENYFGASAKDAGGIYFAIMDKDQKMYITVNGEKVNSLEEKDSLGGSVLAGLTVQGEGIEFNTAQLSGEYKIVEIHDKSTYVGENGETITDSKAVPVEITLPLVNEKGTVLNAHVYPKNTEDKPTTTKEFNTEKDETGKFTQPKPEKPQDISVGTKVPYIVKTKVPAQSKYATANWFDNMTEGLTYNEDLLIKIGEVELEEKTHYNYEKTENGFSVKLNEEGLKLINNKEKETIVTLTYTATLNEKAVVAIPESNDVTFHYGNNEGHGNTPVPVKPSDKKITVTKTWAKGVELPEGGIDVIFTLYNAQTGKQVGDVVKKHVDKVNNINHTFKNLDNDIEYKVVESWNGYSAEYTSEGAGKVSVKNHKDNNPEPNNPDEPKVVTGGALFVKTDESGEPVRLPDAEFAVYKLVDGVKNYLKGQSLDRTEFNDAQKAYEAAVKSGKPDLIASARLVRDNAWTATLANMNIWSTDIKEALKLRSNENGQFEIAGLESGEYGLEEITSPKGYAKRSDVIFKITTDAEQVLVNEIEFVAGSDVKDAEQIINRKVSIPQTGGIGTLIFTVVGLSVMAVAVYVLFKNNKKDEIA